MPLYILAAGAIAKNVRQEKCEARAQVFAPDHRQPHPGRRRPL